MPKILVLNRMHLDEWPADEVAAILGALRGHPEIVGFTRQAPSGAGCMKRGYDGNITDCFPGSPEGNREQRDAWTVTRLAQDADLVLDIHGTKNHGWDFPFYGPAGRGDALVTGTASLLGCDRAAVIAAPHPAGLLRHYVGWDLSPGNTILKRLPGWLTDIADGWVPPSRPMTEYRMVGAILAADALRLGLERRYPRFARLPDEAMRDLGFPTPAHAFSWGAELYGHTGYWGEIAVPYRDAG